MAVDIKFCGMTRGEDVVLARALGARYLGFVFAPSPRQLTIARARALLHALASAGDDTHSAEQALREPQRVGVFVNVSAAEIARSIEILSLDVAQLHGAGDGALVRTLRGLTPARLWTVVHVGPEGVDTRTLDLAMEGDAMLLDAKTEGALGGTGRAFDWSAVRQQLEPYRAIRPVILAGGLTAENVGRAITILAPDAVDVSSGVERSPGIKDEARMRAFAHAVHGVVAP